MSKKATGATSAKIQIIKEKMAEKREKEQTPQEKFTVFKVAVIELLKVQLVRFNLRTKNIGDTEFIVYQGALSNVWARFSIDRMTFYRTPLERQFEKAGLIEPSNDTVYRR